MAKHTGWRKEPARHALAAKGIKTKAHYHAMASLAPGALNMKRVEVPQILYHGTSTRNLPRIMEDGISVGKDPTPMTVSDGRYGDSANNVSLANAIHDAFFFAVGSAGWLGDQAIIEVDANLIPEDSRAFVGRRNLFGRRGRYEFKFYSQYGGVPPEAIRRVLIRAREGEEIVENWYTPEEIRAAINRGELPMKEGIQP